MSAIVSSKPQLKRSFLSQVLWLIKSRPLHFLRATRGYLTFLIARILRPLWIHSGINLGENVRLQRNSSLMAEKPDAIIKIGSHSIIYENAKLEAYGQGKIEIGECSILGDIKIVSRYGIKIGDRMLSSWNVFIQDYDPHPIDPNARRDQVLNMVSNFKPQFDSGFKNESLEQSWDFPGEGITLGNDVWLGANVTILKGVKLGDGCVVATGSVLLRGEYPARSVIAGNPAKVVKEI